MTEFEAALLARIDTLVGALQTHIAVQSGLTASLVQNTAAANAVADSHAKLLHALITAEEEPAPAAPMSEHERTIAGSQLIDADGNAVTS